jgi:lysophospholipase L1-like esterase
VIRLSIVLAAAALQPPVPDERFHILQLGDSHTAGDAISGPLRRLLQARLGEGGRGVLPPGRPYPGYLTHGVTAGQSGSWGVSASFGPSFPGTRAVGVSGYTLTSRSPGSSLGVTSDDAANRFDRITVCALKEPGAGALRLRIGREEEKWDLASRQEAPACRSLESAALTSSASLTTEDARPISITSIATFRRAGGIALSNLGVSGSQLVHLGRQDERIARAELEAYRPDLIVLAFGTNEAFSPRFDAAAYEAVLRSGIARLRRLAGTDVPILLIAPPDAATRNAALAGIPVRICAPGMFVPAALAEVRERQRRVASELGLGFVDAGAAMGGPCSSLAWQRRGWMRADLVHFTRAGGEQLSLRLAAAFLALVR